MVNKWHEIWNRRSAALAGLLDLDALIKLDGFDSGAGRIAPEDWRKYSRTVAEKIGLKDGASVYEVGCGCGAFLYALGEQFSITVGGNDYSAGLIDTARQIFPDDDFECLEAAHIDPGKKYDFVISNGVFHYFTPEYARDVLFKMMAKANKAVCVLEIPDKKTEAQSEQLRRDILTPEEYEKKYAGLKHTYYERDWFENIAAGVGLSCETFDGCVPNYAQNKFRFGCVIRK